ARRDGKKIIPLCPYAKKEFEKKPEYQDVLRQS
ncbi:N-acetyltransferase, partial [Enterococcus faecium]|nr:N-acetyltransferase [Enterococcus faecium]